MKKNSIFICAVLLLNTTVHTLSIAQNRSKGLVFDDTKYGKEAKLGFGLAFTGDPKPYVSLKPYCPTPGNQGAFSSCVGWASGYGAYTISYCVKNNITDQNTKDQAAFNAMYVYAKILPPMADCNSGTSLDDAMRLLNGSGDCKKNTFVPLQCEKPGPDADAEASKYLIKDYGKLFDPSDNPDTKISATVNSLAANKPVVIGMLVTPSFEALGQGVWAPYDKQEITGGHAMVVIGYDRMEKTFEVMNSWTTNWGDHGFGKISFSDYGDMVKYGFQINLGGGAVEHQISGDFHFKHYTGMEGDNHVFSDITPTLGNNIYNVAVNKGDYFRLAATNMTKDCYVYVFSYKPDKSVEILFPTDKAFGFTNVVIPKQIPRVINDDAVITIPDSKDGGFTSDQAGEDYLCILFSSKVINNIQDLVTRTKNSQKSDFMGKLADGFGSCLVSQDRIKYNSGFMGASASIGDAYIVPIVMRAIVN